MQHSLIISYAKLVPRNAQVKKGLVNSEIILLEEGTHVSLFRGQVKLYFSEPQIKCLIQFILNKIKHVKKRHNACELIRS